MLHKRIIPPVLLVLALAAPGTAFGMPGSEFSGGSSADDSTPAAAAQDLRSPDVRDAAAGAIQSQVQSSVPQDLRSPDVRDAASGVVQSSVSQDLRSPDVRDVASGTLRPAEPVTAVPASTSDGFEWSSAAIGAAAMLAIVLALGAAAALVVPRRRMRSPMTH